MIKGKMTVREKQELMEIIEKQMKIKEEEPIAKEPVVDTKGMTIREKIHLYMSNFIKTLNGQQSRGGKVFLSIRQKETLKGLTEISVSILGYGIVGGFSVSLLLILTPCGPEGCIMIVEWLKSNFSVGVLAMIFGTGSIIYLFFDLTTYIRDLIIGKRDR